MAALSTQTLKALRLINEHESVGAGWFAVAMGYHKPGNGGRMKGQTGASVLKRLQARGLVKVWDEWFKGGGYCTLACLTDKGIKALEEAA